MFTVKEHHHIVCLSITVIVQLDNLSLNIHVCSLLYRHVEVITSPVSELLVPLSCEAGPALNLHWFKALCLTETHPFVELQFQSATLWVNAFV